MNSILLLIVKAALRRGRVQGKSRWSKAVLAAWSASHHIQVTSARLEWLLGPFPFTHMP